MAVRIGIIGYGVIGSIHAKCISQIENARLVAVCNRSKDRLERAAADHGVDLYSDYEEMLRRDDIDLIDICTPSGLHGDHGIAAAEAEKHVLVEKPIDIRLDKIDKLIRMCKERRIKLGGIFQHRFDPAKLALKRALEEGKFGKLVLGSIHVKWYRDQSYYDKDSWRGTWELDGGCLMNQTIHYVDLLQWMMGPVESVYGNIGTLTHKMEAEDVGTAVLRFRNGALGVIEGSTSVYPGLPERIEIHGERGTVEVEGSRITVWNFKDWEEMESNTKEMRTGATEAGDIGIESHRLQIEDMIKAIQADRDPAITGEEARKAVEIVLSIYESARRGEAVKLPLG